MITNFSYQLRRIGELPLTSTATVNLWVSDKTPEQLLETLKRIPDRPATATLTPATTGQGKAQLQSPGRKDNTAALDKQIQEGLAEARVTQTADLESDGRLPPIHQLPVSTSTSPSIASTPAISGPSRIHDSDFQRETGNIFMDPRDPTDTGLLESKGDSAVNVESELEKKKDEKGEGGEDRCNPLVDLP